MKMKITDTAKATLEKILNEKGAEGIRLFKETGCCGPQIALSLDEPKTSDRIEEVNDIRIAYDVELSTSDSEQLTLDTDATGLVLIGGGSCCG